MLRADVLPQCRIDECLIAAATGAMNLFATLLAMTVIDKLGRRALLLIGSVGTAFCLFGVSAIFFTNRNQGFLVVRLSRLS